MSLANETTLPQLHLVGIDELRKRSGWFLILGIVIIILGMIALGFSVLTTLASMVFVGWLMILGGVLQTAHGFSCKAWSGFFIDLLTGILYTVTGFMMIAHPAAAAVALTLMIAMLLVAGGLFRIVAAIAVRTPNAIWLFLHGAVNLLLGIAIIQQWPLSGLQVIGIFVGIDMMFNGWSLVMLAIAVKNLSKKTS